MFPESLVTIALLKTSPPTALWPRSMQVTKSSWTRRNVKKRKHWSACDHFIQFHPQHLHVHVITFHIHCLSYLYFPFFSHIRPWWEWEGIKTYDFKWFIYSLNQAYSGDSSLLACSNPLCDIFMPDIMTVEWMSIYLFPGAF